MSGSAQAQHLPTLGRRGARYAVFFGIYLYQGLVAGFSLTALANHYAGLGVSASEVGFHFAIAGLPWIIQPILWGPLIDKPGSAPMGRRRIWAVLAILGAQLSLGLLCFVPRPDALTWVGLAFLVHSIFASLLDTACDRMIMDHVPADELGRMSGCTRGGFVIGTGISAALFGSLLSVLSFGGCAGLLAGLTTLALLPVFVVRESIDDALLSLTGPIVTTRRSRPLPSAIIRILAGLRRPATLRLLGLCFALDFALSLFEVRFNVELVQIHGWDAVAVSRLQAGCFLVSGTVGALGVGMWSDRSGPLPAVRALLLGGAVAFMVSAIVIVAGFDVPALPLILGFTTVLPNLLVVALVPALMRASRRRPGSATRFEAFMAMMNLGSVAGAAASGSIAGLLTSGGVAGLVGFVFLICRWQAAGRIFSSTTPHPRHLE